jgi:hypothetical protein
VVSAEGVVEEPGGAVQFEEELLQGWVAGSVGGGDKVVAAVGG